MAVGIRNFGFPKKFWQLSKEGGLVSRFHEWWTQGIDRLSERLRETEWIEGTKIESRWNVWWRCTVLEGPQEEEGETHHRWTGQDASAAGDVRGLPPEHDGQTRLRVVPAHRLQPQLVRHRLAQSQRHRGPGQTHPVHHRSDDPGHQRSPRSDLLGLRQQRHHHAGTVRALVKSIDFQRNPRPSKPCSSFDYEDR